MTNLLTTIAPKSDQLNADDLIGRSITIRVAKVSLRGEADQPIAIHYDGDNGKPYLPCKSMRRVLVHVWGGDGNVYVGRRMALYRDDKVQFGGLAVGGIRISHMSNITNEITMALTATRANRKPFTVKPLPDAESTEGDNGGAAAKTAAPKISAEVWANQQIAILNDMGDEITFDEWVTANGKKMAALKAKDEGVWTTLNQIVADTRKKLVGEFA